jgi:GT2 family glycosyltransferase
VAGAPELTVVVLSFRNERTVLAAVDSLLDQDPVPEVLVSHSGAGPTPEILGRERPEVRVLASAARLSCSQARNAGIRAARTPLVGFLEADCIAEPGWVAGRLREHRRGAEAVASAVTNAYPHSASAWASHFLRYQGRSPDAGSSDRLLLGLSCHRRLFDRFGVFREDLPGGEDSEFTARLLAEVPIVWAADVRSAHRNADDPAALLRDHYFRGVRRGRTESRLSGEARTLEAAAEALRNVPRAVAWAGRLAASSQDPRPLGAAALLLPATAAYLAGLVSSRRESRP